MLDGARVVRRAAEPGPPSESLQGRRPFVGQWRSRRPECRHPAIALTKGSDFSRYGLIEGHAYAVLAVRGNQITLRNPWGYDGPVQQGADDGIITVSWDIFKAGMLGYTIA